MQRNYIKELSNNQDFVENIPQENKVPIFTEKKKKANYLALIENELGNHAKAERLEICGTSLVFEKTEESMRLVFGNFCRVRLCPMCSWRRSAKLQAQMYKISEYLGDEYGFIFLTLTVKNCEPAELRETLQTLQYAWQKFKNYKPIKKIMKGYYRGIEVTRDGDQKITRRRYRQAKLFYDRHGIQVGDDNPNYNTYHPHYHIVLAVPRSYFTSRDYIRKETFREIWQNCLQVDYAVQIDVRAVRPKNGGDEGLTAAVNEVTKYSIKDTDYLTGELAEDREVVRDLERELHDLRFVSLGGVFRKAHAALKLTDYDDPEADDATFNVDASKLVAFIWQTGVTRYDESAPYLQHYLGYEAARLTAKNQS